VFEVRPDHPVALLPVERAGDAGDPVARALGERHLDRVAAEELGYPLPGPVELLPRVRVHPLPAGRLELVVLQTALGGVDDPSRAGATGAGVQVDGPVERRDVRSELRQVHARH